MPYRDILVHLDESGQTRQRLDLAVELARQHGAQLSGVSIAEFMAIPEYMPAQALRAQEESVRARNQRLHELFESAVRAQDIAYAWHETDSLSSGGSVLDALAVYARYVDLVVVGQTDPGDLLSPVPHDLPGQLALMSGVPVLAVPYAWRPHPVGRRVMVAWDGGREAIRAMHDALPFMASAESVQVVTFGDGARIGSEGPLPGADIGAHLARHGLTVEVEHHSTEGIDVPEAMLSAASDYQADLIVMGAYGTTRLREMVLGGATRSILRHMTVPVLMAH